MYGGNARIQQAGGFIAGVLIGLSITAPLFAVPDTGYQEGHVLVALGSLILFVIGLILKIVTSARQWRQPNPQASRPGTVAGGGEGTLLANCRSGGETPALLTSYGKARRGEAGGGSPAGSMASSARMNDNTSSWQLR